MVLTTMLNKVLKNTPSYREFSKCRSCEYSQERIIPIVGVNSNVYNNRMDKLEDGIMNNFPVDILCDCSNTLETEREFSDHIFVEVIMRYSIFDNVLNFFADL